MSDDFTSRRARDQLRRMADNVPSRDRETVPTRATRVEVERMITEAATSDLPEMQALSSRLRAALDRAPAQAVFHFWPTPSS